MTTQSSPLTISVFQASLLTVLLGCIIGPLWLIGSLQESVFFTMVGREYYNAANSLVFVALIPIMFAYMALLNVYNRYHILAIGLVLFSVLFGVCSFYLADPIIGISNTVADPARIFAWIYFFLARTFATVLVTVYWSFFSSVVDISLSKRIYPIVAFFAQLSSLTGAHLAKYVTVLGFPGLTCIGACWLFVGFLLLVLFIQTLSKKQYHYIASSKKAVSQTGLLEGARLLFSSWYLIGILGVSVLYQICIAVMDYQWLTLVSIKTSTPEAMSVLKGVYGERITIFIMLFSLFGTTTLLHTLGVRFCLMLYPIVTLGAIVVSLNIPDLAMMMYMLILVKGLSIALSNPVKEVLYVPANDEVRFKVKGWIDMFGYRGAYAFGSTIISFFPLEFGPLLRYGAWLSFAVIAIWLLAAYYVGTHFNKQTSVN